MLKEAEIQRINELSRLSKTRELTEEEAQEQKNLRQAYIESWKNAAKQTLDNTYIDDGCGNRTKLPKKKK